MLSFAKFYDKINTSLVFFKLKIFYIREGICLSLHNILMRIYVWGVATKTLSLKRYTRQGFADFTPCKNKLTLNIVKLFIKCYNIYNNVG